ncbi:MAG: helix-turn-helix transcriptional regulator [Lachnospiraceae bacterium]|nr:helix-turn-helix transcriptional regulator [Lachnospiraceae bacterium]
MNKCDCMMFLTVNQKKNINRYRFDPRNGIGLSFRDELYAAMKRHRIASMAQLSVKTGPRVSESFLSKIVNKNRTSNRDALWAIAMAMHMDMSETKRLFKSANQSFEVRITPKMFEREKLIKAFICNGIWDIEDLDEQLETNGMNKLCQD